MADLAGSRDINAALYAITKGRCIRAHLLLKRHMLLRIFRKIGPFEHQKSVAVALQFYSLLLFFSSGGTVLGLVSDCMGKRAPAVTASLMMAMGALVGYSRE